MIAFRGPVEAAAQKPPCGKDRWTLTHGGFWTVVSISDKWSPTIPQPMIFHLRCCHPHLPPLALQKNIRVSVKTVVTQFDATTCQNPDDERNEGPQELSYESCVTHFAGLDSAPTQFAPGVTELGRKRWRNVSWFFPSAMIWDRLWAYDLWVSRSFWSFKDCIPWTCWRRCPETSMWQGPMDFNTWRILDGSVYLRQMIPNHPLFINPMTSLNTHHQIQKQGLQWISFSAVSNAFAVLMASPGKVIHQQTQPMIFHLRCCHPHLPPLALQKNIRVSVKTVVTQFDATTCQNPDDERNEGPQELSYESCVTHFAGLDSAPTQFAPGVTELGRKRWRNVSWFFPSAMIWDRLWAYDLWVSRSFWSFKDCIPWTCWRRCAETSMWQGPMDFNTWRILDGSVYLRQMIPNHPLFINPMTSLNTHHQIQKQGLQWISFSAVSNAFAVLMASPGKVIHQQTQPMRKKLFSIWALSFTLSSTGTAKDIRHITIYVFKGRLPDRVLQSLCGFKIHYQDKRSCSGKHTK